MRKLTYELALPFMFAAGALAAYLAPFRLGILVAIARFFTLFFFTFAPVFIFIILAGSLSTRLGGSRVAKYSITLFFAACLTSSILASTILSLEAASHGELEAGGSASYLLNTLARSLMRPIPISIAAGLAVALIAPRSIKARRAASLANKALMKSFKLIVKALPIVSLSFGASFYYSLGGRSLPAYIETLATMLTLSLLYVLTALIAASKLTGANLRDTASYTLKTFLTGASLPSSYILLAPHLEIFNSHFKVDRSIGDTVLALGSALNRAGSIMGVITSIGVISKYTGAQITPLQYLILALTVTVIGFASPGIPGGTILVALPAILELISVNDIDSFSLASIAVFNGITPLTAATNTVTTGYIALITNKILLNDTERKPANQPADAPQYQKATKPSTEEPSTKHSHTQPKDA